MLVSVSDALLFDGVHIECSLSFMMAGSRGDVVWPHRKGQTDTL